MRNGRTQPIRSRMCPSQQFCPVEIKVWRHNANTRLRSASISAHRHLPAVQWLHAHSTHAMLVVVFLRRLDYWMVRSSQQVATALKQSLEAKPIPCPHLPGSSRFFDPSKVAAAARARAAADSPMDDSDLNDYHREYTSARSVHPYCLNTTFCDTPTTPQA